MKRFLILLFFSMSAFAQAPPVIRAVVPAVGPSSGGTLVTISGENLGLPPGFACVLPCPAKVTFGGILAALQSETDNALVVKTPPHNAGSVEVTVVTGDGRTATKSNAFLYTDSAEAAFERILLPVYLEAPVPGSNGSQWETQLWLRNNGANGITLAPWTCRDVCPPVIPLTRTLQPRETLLNLPAIPQTNVGRILYINRDGADDLSAGLRLYEKSRSSDVDAGTEVPVIRENELRSAPAHLHNVPLNSRFRVMLRVYELALDEADFRVRVFEEGEGILAPNPILEFTLHAASNETAPFRTRPAYSEYGTLTDLLATPLPRPEKLRIDVEPLGGGSRYWTFVSITNNDTQRVTLVTPQ